MAPRAPTPDVLFLCICGSVPDAAWEMRVLLGPWHASCNSAIAEMQRATEPLEGVAGAEEAVAQHTVIGR